VHSSPYFRRVVRVELTDNGTAIDKVTVVNARTPEYHQTTAALAGDKLYVVGGSPLPNIYGGSQPAGEPKPQILEIPVGVEGTSHPHMNEIRFALRQLRKSPGFTAVAILTLALGIGANTSIFSVVNAVLLRPLPYPEGNQLAIVNQTSRSMPEISFAFPDYVDMRRDNTVFEHFAITRRESYPLSGLDGREPEQISGAIVTANFFQVIGLQPQLGRTFTEEEDRPGGPALAVISDALWQRVFSRDANVLGRAFTFGGQPYTVVGVMPPQMFSPRTVDVWFPLMRRSDNEQWQDRENHPGLTGWARLKRGVSFETAQAQLSTIAARLAAQYPQSNAENGVKITPFLENQVGEYRTSLKLLLARSWWCC
jgi:putative ABC transport system permease protein